MEVAKWQHVGHACDGGQFYERNARGREIPIVVLDPR